MKIEIEVEDVTLFVDALNMQLLHMEIFLLQFIFTVIFRKI